MKPSLICSAMLITAALGACTHSPAINTAAYAPTKNTTMLTDYHWTMNRAVDAYGNNDPHWIYVKPEKSSVTLTFDQQRVVVTGLCNNMGASYTTEATEINIRQVVSTMKMCPDQALMRYEQAFGQRLPQVASWAITRIRDEPEEQPSLTLRFEDGAQWVLTGKPTAEKKYGSTGETIFLEVAAHTAPCAHPLIPEHQCLRVRTVHYDASGLKQDHGPWENFYSHIENYEHVPGVRNVLRVKRYTRPDVPADASRYAYVLDMVVESDSTGSQIR